MRKTKKIAALFTAGVCLTSALTGCQILEKAVDEVVTSLVKWDLNSTYLNQHDENYLQLCGITKEEAEASYWEGIGYDVENFCYYWGIIDGEYVTVADLDTELHNRLSEMCSSISQKVKYDVQSASIQDDSSYSVKVVVEPIDIMEQAGILYDSETYEPLNDFWAKSETLDFETMTDEEYIAYCNEYGYIMVEMVEELLPKLGYMEEKSMLIQVTEENDVWELNEDDLGNFYNNVVYYPYE